MGREIKNAIKNYRNSIHQFHYKEYVFALSRGLAEHFLWFCQTSNQELGQIRCIL